MGSALLDWEDLSLPENQTIQGDNSNRASLVNVADLNVLFKFLFYAENLAFTGINSISYQPKVVLSFNLTQARSLLLLFTFDWLYSKSNSQFYSELKINGVQFWELNKTPSDTANQNTTTKFFKFNFPVGLNTIELNYRSSSNNATATIGNAIIGVA